MSSAAFNNSVDRNHLTFNVNCGRKCVLINPDTLARVGVFVILLFYSPMVPAFHSTSLIGLTPFLFKYHQWSINIDIVNWTQHSATINTRWLNSSSCKMDTQSCDNKKHF